MQFSLMDDWFGANTFGWQAFENIRLWNLQTKTLLGKPLQILFLDNG